MNISFYIMGVATLNVFIHTEFGFLIESFGSKSSDHSFIQMTIVSALFINLFLALFKISLTYGDLEILDILSISYLSPPILSLFIVSKGKPRASMLHIMSIGLIYEWFFKLWIVGIGRLSQIEYFESIYNFLASYAFRGRHMS